MGNLFVWVDIPVRDLQRAMKFYAAVLDVQITKQDGGGFSFAVFQHAGEEVSGCLVPATENAPSQTGPLLYLNVSGRLAPALAAAEACGGRILQAPHAIGPHGWRALISDSEGNRVALHSPTA